MQKASELLEHLLDFGPDWEVTNIAIDDADQQVDVHIRFVADQAPSPVSDEDERLPIYDHRSERRWRHLNLMHYQTWIICRLPRVRTADGKVRTIQAPWADPNQRYTFWFEAVAIELAQLTKSPTKAAGFLGTSYDVLCGIIDRAVRRGLARRNKQSLQVRRLALDEKAFQRGHQYITVLSCPDTGRVYEVTLGRKQVDAEGALQQLDRQVGLHQVQAVSMDMWKAYINSVNEQLPNARIVHDKFHIMAWLNKAVDRVRRKEVKQEPALKKTRYIWLKNPDNHTDKQASKFEQINQMNLQTGRAWQIKENFKGLYRQDSPMEGFHYFFEWFRHVSQQAIGACRKVAKMLDKHLWGILNYLSDAITNARAEQVNSKIQQLKSIARGYRNFDNFRNAILFYFGKLDLYPQGFQ